MAKPAKMERTITEKPDRQREIEEGTYDLTTGFVILTDGVA